MTREEEAQFQAFVDRVDAYRRDRTSAELTAALGRVAGDILRLARRVDELAVDVTELQRMNAKRKGRKRKGRENR